MMSMVKLKYQFFNIYFCKITADAIVIIDTMQNNVTENLVNIIE